MFFRILGPLMVDADAGSVTIAGGRHRKILVTLLLDANRAVSVDRLVDVVWGVSPPATAVEQVQNCTGSLRRLLSSIDPAVRLTRRPSAYLLYVDESQVDAHVFQRLVEEARKCEASGALAEAGAALRNAVRLWYGNAFEDVVSDALRGQATWLEELRTQSMLRYTELEIAAGDPARAIADLKTWSEAHPYHEGLSAQLIRALHDCGRTAEALEAYQRIRSRLNNELGLDPGEQLQALQQDILSSGRPSAPVGNGHEHSREHVMRLLSDSTSMLAEAIRLLRKMVGRETI